MVYINIISSFYTCKNRSFIEYFKISPPMIFALFLLSFIVTIGTIVGFALLIIPGILLSYGWILSTTIYFNEYDESIFSSICRSWNLTDGSKWQIFGVTFFMAIVETVIFLLLHFYLS